MAKFLAIFNDTIDEIEVNGFIVMTEREVEEYEELALSITWPFTHNMGEDELEFSSGEDLLSKTEFKEITNDEAKVMKKLFNNEFGVVIGFDTLENIVDEEEDDFDEDEEDDDYDSPYQDEDFNDNY
jgi:hypothetical protein